jgi:hypothetical protein
MTSDITTNGLLETTEGKPTRLPTGGGEWSPEEIKAMTPRRATQTEYKFRAKQEVAKKEKLVKDAAYNRKLVENYKNNIKTFRVYDPITKSYSPANKE